MCTESENKIASKLIDIFIEHSEELPYVNLTESRKYKGWVSDFGIELLNGKRIKLEINDNDNDLFLLFVLAIIWSRSGPWENSAYFVAYLISNNKSTSDYWKTSAAVDNERDRREKSAAEIVNSIRTSNTRKKVSFRKDIFSSVALLANKWDEIKKALEYADNNGDYIHFMKYLRSIRGLGVKERKILIKIPLILRELRCQEVYKNIPGELCCVPDKRVLDTGKELGIKLANPYYQASINIRYLIACSRKIYDLFGDLYDIPLFAYEDLKKYFI
jgi:hypothetical protein